MEDAITDVLGIELGHAQDMQLATGCTVILCRGGAVVGVDVRGGAPGTRETDLCGPGGLVERADAILLTGGSAFGLEAASGVMRYLWEHDYGFKTEVTHIPIVPGAVIYDLAIGGVAWPDAAMGYSACAGARTGPVGQGCVGAGTGATVGKLLGMAQATKSGVGSASERTGNAAVGAVVVVNALGNVLQPGTERVLAGTRDARTGLYVDAGKALNVNVEPPVGNTTIGVVATDAILTSAQANHLARVAHDGLARMIRPVHTIFDGDTLFCLATGRGNRIEPTGMVRLGYAVVEVVERAIVRAVSHAVPLAGLPAMNHES